MIIDINIMMIQKMKSHFKRKNMQPKLLTINDYFDHFSFQEYGTGCGIETEPKSGENYFYAQTFLPKDFFNLTGQSLFLNPLD